MIIANVGRDGEKKLTSFDVNHHGETLVCAAVSLLVINTVNSIETLTEADISYEYNEEGGYLSFVLLSDRETAEGKAAGLLLDALDLGFQSVAQAHPGEFKMKAK